jgi:DNA-binding NarL/FixJ family response regulator
VAVLKILIADDHRIIRDGLRSLFEKNSDLRVIAEAEDGETAIRLALEMRPDIVLMDLNMPKLNGIEATRQIVEGCPSTKVVALSMRCDKQVIGETLRAGAVAFLPKDAAFRELLVALQTVMNNHVYLSPEIAELVVETYVRKTPQEQADAIATLTPRERQVLQLVAEGKTTKEIAALMDIGAKTVDTHRQHIMSRLNLHSVAELTKFAIREGLTALDR